MDYSIHQVSFVIPGTDGDRVPKPEFNTRKVVDMA